MHALIDLAPANIVPLFEQLTEEWAQQWLLNAAEAWAALHPHALEAVRNLLEETMRKAHFEAQLQAWIVLCKLADILRRDRPSFPMPHTAAPQPDKLVGACGGILETEPLNRGLTRCSNRHAAAKGKLHRLQACGFDFSSLEREIATELLGYSSESNWIVELESGPHRDGDFVCGGLEVEHAVGDAIKSVLSTEWCSEENMQRLAQGLFGNEDPWILRHTPLPSPAPDEWPTEELGALTRVTDIPKLLGRFRYLAANQELPEGWTVAAACIYAATWQEDFAFFSWLEETRVAPQLIAGTRRPTTLSGRTFNWWLGDHFEPSQQKDQVVMGFFTGGTQRLIHSSLEIQPPKLWREFGWRPGVIDPLQWFRNDERVAYYQSFHGPTYNSVRGDHHRQPLLHRWLVRSEAINAAADASQRTFRLREDFERAHIRRESRQ